MGGADNKENLVKLTPEEHFIAHQLLVKMYPGNHKLIYAMNMMTVCNSRQDRNNKQYGWIKRQLSTLKAGIPMSEDTKLKISASNKGKPKPPRTEEHSRKISLAKQGKPQSPESNQKRSETQRGRPLSQEHIQKIKDTKLENGSPLTGVPLTDDHKNKIRNALTGVPKSPEHVKKLSLWQKGIKKKPLTTEHKQKVSDSLKGKPKPVLKCPHCNMTGGSSQMKRWHFDNCKLIPSPELI